MKWIDEQLLADLWVVANERMIRKMVRRASVEKNVSSSVQRSNNVKIFVSCVNAH